jgi:hypothetical protein
MASTNRYKTNKAFLRTLERTASTLHDQHAALQQQNAELQLRQHFLHAFCVGLACLKQQTAASIEAQGVSTVDAQQVLQELAAEEGSLLELLQQAGPRQPGADAGAGAGAADADEAAGADEAAAAAADSGGGGGSEALFPESNPMGFFLQHARVPLIAGAAAIDTQQLCAVLRDVTLELSVQLHMLDSAQQAQHGAITARMRHLWDM